MRHFLFLDAHLSLMWHYAPHTINSMECAKLNIKLSVSCWFFFVILFQQNCILIMKIDGRILMHTTFRKLKKSGTVFSRSCYRRIIYTNLYNLFYFFQLGTDRILLKIWQVYRFQCLLRCLILLCQNTWFYH